MQFKFQFSQTVFVSNLGFTTRTLDLYQLGFTVLVSFNYMFLQIILIVSFFIAGVTSEPDQIFMSCFNVHF